MMTSKQIQRKWAVLHRKQVKLYEDLGHLQSLCEHPNVQKKHKGNTDNYDPQADRYWTEWTCPDCRKFWNTDQ